MPCREGCGLCCDPVMLSQSVAEALYDPASERRFTDQEWIINHWAPYAAWGEDAVAVQCTEYDVATRSCRAYESRPDVCRRYPFYDGPAVLKDSDLRTLVCGYQAEAGRTVLPIVEVR